MDIIKILVIFIAIMFVLILKKPLWLAIITGTVVCAGVYRLSPLATLETFGKGMITYSTIQVVLTIYGLSVLQYLMDKRGMLRTAEKSLSGLFQNRRITTGIAPTIMGSLPGPAMVLIAAPIVDSATEGLLSKEDRTFVSTFLRHIPEICLPTFSAVIIATNLSGISLPQFVLTMFPMMPLMWIMVYFLYLRKIPREEKIQDPTSKGIYIKALLKSLWPIIGIMLLLIGLNLEILLSIGITLIAFALIMGTSFQELRDAIAGGFNFNVVASTLFVMAFSHVITLTGVLNRLPAVISSLPIPTYFVFALVFYIGTILAGLNAVMAVCLPLAYFAIPDGGLPLLILLMGVGHAAMQLSPTHICLTMVLDYYKTGWADLIKRTFLPSILLFVSIFLYYTLLAAIMY